MRTEVGDIGVTSYAMRCACGGTLREGCGASTACEKGYAATRGRAVAAALRWGVSASLEGTPAPTKGVADMLRGKDHAEEESLEGSEDGAAASTDVRGPASLGVTRVYTLLWEKG